jgi:TctA family transporter
LTIGTFIAASNTKLAISIYAVVPDPDDLSVGLDVMCSMVLLTSIHYARCMRWISSISLNIPGEEPATMTT